ncbi:hypothetical protein NKJ23_16280 [Mesorhizobium sp. M0184]|uniref:hypothetical protein n=1 Tax=Mesorhizobium sp. M0184 TaxID=2956906 RepID=UPI00333CEBE4
MADLIRQAVAEGRVTRLPTVQPKTFIPEQVRFHPDTCGCGGEICRAPFLDELDGDSA